MAALVSLVGGCGGSGSPSPPGSGHQQAPFVDDRAGLAEPTPALDAANRQPRGPSVNHDDPPPPIAAAVRSAANAAGCAVRAFPSEADPALHVAREAATRLSIPPLSGAHNDRWADWGVYDRPVPFTYQLHNLEHGGVFVHYGRDVPVSAVNSLREWWAKSPAYTLIAPDTAPAFPTTGVVTGSQQRWLVCKPFRESQISAIDAFASEYRGRGPEARPAFDSSLPRPADLPLPAIPDAGARG